MAILGDRPPGGGGGDGNAAFGAVLRQGDDPSKGLFIYADGTDPSWHLRGVERQLEEAAIRSHLVYENAAETARLLLHFGDDSTDEKRFRVLGGTSGDLPEEVNSQYRVTHRQHPNPAARFAERSFSNRWRARAAVAGAAGNEQFLRVQEGRAALAALDALFPNFIQGRLNGADVDAGTLAVETGSHADGNGMEFAVIAGTTDVAGVASSVEIPQATAGNTAVLAVSADRTGTAFNGTRLVLRRPASSAIRSSVQVNVAPAGDTPVYIQVTGDIYGPAGNGLTVNTFYRASGDPNFVFANRSGAANYNLQIRGTVTVDTIIAGLRRGIREWKWQDHVTIEPVSGNGSTTVTWDSGDSGFTFVSSGAAGAARQAVGRIYNGPSGTANRTLEVRYYLPGTVGNTVTVDLAYDSSVAADSVTATYSSDTNLNVRINGTVSNEDIVNAINNARRNGVQRLFAILGSNVSSIHSTAWTDGTNNHNVTLSGGVDDSAETVGTTSYDAATRILTVAIAATSTAQQIVGWINAVSGFPGTAAVEGIAGGTAARVGTYTAAGGVDAVVGTSRTVTWNATGGAASKGRLTFATDGTETVLQAVDAINASSYPGSALVTSSATGAYPVAIQSMIAAGGRDAVARTPLRVFEDTGRIAAQDPFTPRLILSGLVPGVDTVADAQARYLVEVSTEADRNFAILGTATDFIITAAETRGADHLHLQATKLTGGRDQLTKEAVVVTIDGAGQNSVQWGVRLYGSNTPAALRTTLGELRDAWTSYAKQAGADYPQAVLTGEATEVVDVDNLPAAPVGGSNYIPPSPIEFLVRDEDQADGKNIEVRYHADHDTQQEILDASLVPATNPGGAEVIEIFGTDLTAAPEEPPVTRPMYPEAGTTSTTGGQTAAQVRDTVAAFLAGGDNITITRSGNTLTITSTATGGGGGTGGLDAEAVRDTVAAFLRGTPSSAISFTHDDAGNTLTLAIAESAETVPGLVRNVSIDEAGQVSGTVYRAWSGAMLTKLMALFRSNVSQAEAEAGTGTNLRWWSALRVRQAIEAVFTPAEKAKLGGIPGTAIERGEEAQQNPSGTLTGRQKIAYRASIDALGEGDIPESLMELLHNELSAAVSTEQRIGTFTLLNSNNVVYLVTIGTAPAEFFAGDDLSALREADAHTLDGVTIYSNAGRQLLIKQPNNTSREVKIWLVDDVQAFASIAARFLPTVTEPETRAAIDSATAQQRRIWTLERVIQTIRANRDPDAFIGASEADGELTLTRRGGTNPVDLPLGGGGSGAFKLRQIGARFTSTSNGDGNYEATGITPPAMDDDEVIYIRYAGPGEGDPPAYGVMRGSLFNALTVKAAGNSISSSSDTYWTRVGANSLSSFDIAKTATGELLLGSDSSTQPYWIEAYAVSISGSGGAGGGASGSLEIVAGTAADPWTFDFRNAGADGRIQGTLSATSAQPSTAVNFRDSDGTIRAMTVGDIDTDALYAIELLESDSSPRLTSHVLQTGAELLARIGIVTGSVASGLRRTVQADIPLEYQVPATRLGFFRVKANSGIADADSQQLVVRAAGINFVLFLKTLASGGGGTAVAANPSGTDGATLNRLKIANRNFNLPTGGYLFYTRPPLTIPADVTATGLWTTAGQTFLLLNASIPGRVYPDIDFTSEWFGNFEMAGDANNGAGSNARQLEFVLKTTHTFNGKTVVHSRDERTLIPRQFTANFAMSKLSGVSAISVGEYTDEENNVITITEADLAGPVTIRFDLTVRGLTAGGDPATLEYDSIGFSHVQYRAYQIDHGEGTMTGTPVGDHNRYIGWSAAQNPTAGEFTAGSTETDDTLAVPALPAQFSTAGGAYVWFAVPKTQGRPTGVYRSGNTVNQIGAFTQVNDWTPQGGSPHYVYATNREQSGTALMGASYRIEYGGSA